MSDDLPEAWAIAKVADFAIKVGSGATPRGGSDSYKRSGIPLIRSQNVHFDGFRNEGLVYLDDVQANALKEVTVEAGDVLLNITGASIGRVTQAPKRMQGARVNQHVCIIRPISLIDSGYLTRYLCSPRVQKMVMTEEYGVTRQALTKGQILDFDIPIAPAAEQKRIIAKVEALLAGVNAARQRLANVPAMLKRFRQAVLAAACSGRLTAEWRVEKTELEPGHDRLEGPEKLPNSWGWAMFGDLISELRNGISTKPNPKPPGHPILRISSTRPRRVLLDDVRYLPDADDLVEVYGLRDGDLLFTRYNGSLDLLGVCGMVQGLGKRTLLYPDKLMRVRIVDRELLPEYVEAFFGSPQARHRIEAKSKSSAGQQGVSGSDIKRQSIAVPPLAEQREIVRRVDGLFRLADAIEKRVAAATARVDKLTQAILAKAFRGELVPTEVELARQEGRDYEPASVLLERIRAAREAAAHSSTERSPRRRKS
jgi:type I restriction enzyme S subunit